MKEIEDQNETAVTIMKTRSVGVSEVNLAPLSPAELAVLAAGLPPRVESSADDIAARLAARRSRVVDDARDLAQSNDGTAYRATSSPSPADQLRVTGFRGNPLRVVLSSGDEATVTQKLIDAFASPSPFDLPDDYDTLDGHLQKAASGTDYFGFAVESVTFRGRRATIVDRDFPIGTPVTVAKPLRPEPAPNSQGRPAGHCDDDQAWQRFSADYANRSRDDLGKGDMTDFALANAQFMCDRNSLDLIVYQTAAKERIRWLSIQLAAAIAASEGSTNGR